MQPVGQYEPYFVFYLGYRGRGRPRGFTRGFGRGFGRGRPFRGGRGDYRGNSNNYDVSLPIIHCTSDRYD